MYKLEYKGEDIMINNYIIVFENEMVEPIVLRIKQDVNRPNNPTDDEIIEEFIEDNFGGRYYEAIMISCLKSFDI
jgi:protoporphyrinogen oxidase